MSGEPRYETAQELGQRTGRTDSVVCADCGVFVMDKAAHTRFHSILSSHAWSLAVLKTAHVAAHIHGKYDVVERIDSRKFDNWSAEALAEVIAEIEAQDSQQGERLGMGRSGPARGGLSWPVGGYRNRPLSPPPHREAVTGRAANGPAPRSFPMRGGQPAGKSGNLCDSGAAVGGREPVPPAATCANTMDSR